MRHAAARLLVGDGLDLKTVEIPFSMFVNATEIEKWRGRVDEFKTWCFEQITTRLRKRSGVAIEYRKSADDRARKSNAASFKQIIENFI